MSDTSFLNKLLLACSVGRTRLFRNSTGLGWVGQSTRFPKPMTITVQAGDVLIRKARPLHAGLVKGGSDLIGWQSRTITLADVGATWAVFTALEGKQGRDSLSAEQAAFLAAVRAAGGIAGEVRSTDDARRLLDDRSSENLTE